MFFLAAAILLVSSASAYSTDELEDVSDPRLFFANYTSGKLKIENRMEKT